MCLQSPHGAPTIEHEAASVGGLEAYLKRLGARRDVRAGAR
jgi:hypothetical protein